VASIHLEALPLDQTLPLWQLAHKQAAARIASSPWNDHLIRPLARPIVPAGYHAGASESDREWFLCGDQA